MRAERIAIAALAVLAVAGGAAAGSGGPAALEQAIASCKVDATSALLDGGADPNAVDARRQPVVGWLAAGMHCSDGDALAVAKLLDAHGATFDAPRLLANLAPRRLPKTLAFVATKHGAGDPTEALRAIARSEDLESIRALLDAGADPTDGVAKSSALLDATLEAHAAVVAEMLKHVSDKQSPKVLAAADAAARRKDADVTAAFTAAGIVAPAAIPTATPACVAHDLDADEQALLSKLGLPNANKLAGLAGAMECKRLATCGDLELIDCNSAADGPAYYVDRKAQSLLATCGGACMHGCTGCPPKAWTCACVR